MYRRYLLPPLLLSLLLLLPGCWGRQEINETAIIHTIAVDKEKENNIRLTIEISDHVAQGQAPIGLKGRPIYLTAVGESIFEAARKLRSSSSRYLLWAHASAIIFSKELAKEGIQKHFDVLSRQRHFRNTMLVLIADGKAADVFSASVPQFSLISIGLQGLIDSEKSTAATKKTTLMQVYQTLTNKYNQLTIPAVQIYKRPKSAKSSLRTVGVYVFKDDKLLSYMDEIKTKAYNRAINEAEDAVEKISCGKKTEYVTFENLHNHTILSSSFHGNKPVVTIELFADFSIVDLQCRVKTTMKQADKWEHELEKKLKRELADLLMFSQQKNVDILGVGELFHREYPNEWKSMKKQWDTLYRDVQFKIKVTTNIEHTNLLS